MNQRALIYTRGLTHAYGGAVREEVLSSIDLDIHAGEVVLLTGPSGSGKTTLLTLLGGLRHVESGSVVVLGCELRGAPERDLIGLRQRIGYVFQAQNLIEALSAVENVELGIELGAQESRAHSPAARARALAILDVMGLADRATHFPRQLSGGQKQRVAVARALVNCPALVLADEPTAALDAASGRSVANQLRALAQENGSAIILVTHDNRIFDVADRIVTMRDGRIVDCAAGRAWSLALKPTERLSVSAHGDPTTGTPKQDGVQADLRILIAWRNLTSDRKRFVVVVFGMGFALAIMLFQTSLFIGFVGAASRVIRAMDADLLIMGRGISCLEYGFPIEDRYRDIARSIDEVAGTRRVIVSPTSFKKPSGSEITTFLIGSEPSVRGELPHPALEGSKGVLPESVVIDRSNLSALGLTGVPEEVEINGRRTSVVRSVDGFGSFLGAPYIFSDDKEVARLLDYPSGYATFITVQLRPGADIERALTKLRSLLPNVDVYSKAAFASHASAYWVLQTGAGGALLTSAFLGMLLGVAFVSQSTYASTLEKLDEYATMRAMGASKFYVRTVIAAQALIAGVLGAAGGLVAAAILIVQARQAIPWVALPTWLFLVMVATALVMSGLASLTAARAATQVDPARVFRG